MRRRINSVDETVFPIQEIIRKETTQESDIKCSFVVVLALITKVDDPKVILGRPLVLNEKNCLLACKTQRAFSQACLFPAGLDLFSLTERNVYTQRHA